MEVAFEKILVAIDGSETSKRLLDYVRPLSAINESEVLIYHVRQQAYSGLAIREVGPIPVITTDSAAKELVNAGIRAQSIEEEAYWGHTANSIVDAANRYSANLIVIGTRGLSRLPAAVLGSVAYKVLHLAKQPVLVIP